MFEPGVLAHSRTMAMMQVPLPPMPTPAGAFLDSPPSRGNSTRLSTLRRKGLHPRSHEGGVISRRRDHDTVSRAPSGPEWVRGVEVFEISATDMLNRLREH